MPRGIPAPILAELNSASFSVWYLLRITMRTRSLYYCEGAADGTSYDGHAYSAGLLEVSSLQYAISNNQHVNFKLANVTGAITTIDQSESFAGAKFELIEYFPSISSGYVRWTGFADELTERNNRYAIIPAYVGTPTTKTDAPRRTIQTLCPWFFRGNNDAYVSNRDSEGAECPYQRVSTVGFTTTLAGSVDGSSNPVSVAVNALAGSRYFRNGDYVQLDSEVLRVSSGGGTNTLVCARAQKSTTIAAHLSGTQVIWADCQKTWDACADHGMRGNNSSDQMSGAINRNYFGAFPVISAQVRPTSTWTKIISLGAKSSTTNLAGNDSAYDQTLMLAYGRCRVQNPILLAVKAEGDFLLTLWAVCEGLLATNASDDTQTTRLNAYASNAGGELVFVNGARRHDPRPNFGIQQWNGQQDQEPPAFLGVTEFETNKLGLYGTAYMLLRISIKNNPTVDASNLQVDGDFEIRYGRVVRVYTDATTYTRKATTNPAHVLLDLATSRRGAVMDYSRWNIEDIVDLAAHCTEAVASTVDGSSVPRWTFNGAFDKKRPVPELLEAVCQQMYAMPPTIGIDGKYNIKPLKSESLSGVPLFTSTASSDRQILQDRDGSRLRPFRNALAKTVNEYRVNFVAYENSKWIRTQLVLPNEDAQKAVGRILGDHSAGVVSETIDLIGVTTVDEAARIGTLHLRCGKFARGGLSNNFGVKFPASYRDSSDVDLGDIIEVEDSELDATTQRYFRVIDIEDATVAVSEGSFTIERMITAMVHSNDNYDDTALTVYQVTRLDPPTAYDVAAPAVTAFTVTESGVKDANNKLVTRLTFDYTLPSPIENFKSVAVFRSNDDGGGDPTGDWRFVCELEESGISIEYEVTGKTEHFIALSRNIAGVTPSIDTLDASSNYKYPIYSILVDGVTDVLAAPTGLIALGRIKYIHLEWTAYTGSSRTIFKRYYVYRGTTSDPALSTKIGETDTNWFDDSSDTIKANPSTVYYYFLKGVSKLEEAVVNGVALSGLSAFSAEAHDNPGLDGAVPTPAPTLGVIRRLASANPAESVLTIGCEVPGGTANWDTVESWSLQITTDPTFVSFPNDNCLNKTFTGRRPNDLHEHRLNAPGTYYLRAKVTNIFGDSAWSTTVTVSTDGRDNISQDTDLADAPTVIAVTNSTAANVAGNVHKVSWNIPAANTSSLWGRHILLYTASTLPTATTADTGTAGQVTAGSLRLTDLTKSWTPSQWVSPNAHDVIIFSPYRQSSPSWDYEGKWTFARISGNGSNYLDMDIPASASIYTATGLKYYIVRAGVNHHVHEKATAAIMDQIDPAVYSAQRAAGMRTEDIPTGNAAPLYAFVSLATLFAGSGKIGVSSSVAFSGFQTSVYAALSITGAKVADLAITETKIDNDAISTPKLQALSVVAAKIDVGTLDAISVNAGTIAAGTFIGTTFKTASSGARVEIDASGGISCYNPGSALKTHLPISGGDAGFIKAEFLRGIDSYIQVMSNDGATGIIVTDGTNSPADEVQILSNGAIVVHFNASTGINTSLAATVNGQPLWNTSGEFFGFRSHQSTIPTPTSGYWRFWRDSDDGKVYLVYNDPTSGVKSVELT